MDSSGNRRQDGSTCGDIAIQQKSAKELFSGDGQHAKFTPPEVDRAMAILRTLRKKCEHCDVAFHSADGFEIWAHSFVLAAEYVGCDALFCQRGLFLASESLPAQEDIALRPIIRVLVLDLSAEMLDLIIEHAYHTPLHELVGLHNVREVLAVADRVNITKMVEHCCQVLEENLAPDNCVGTYQLATSKRYLMLSIQAFRYIVRNFDKVWTSPEFQSLTASELWKVLYDDELYAPDEVEVSFGAILKWVSADENARRVHLHRFLPLVRFAFCSRADIEKVENDPQVLASQEAVRVMTVVKRSLDQEPGERVDLSVLQHIREPVWMWPRVPKDILFVFGGWNNGVSNQLLTYNCRSISWKVHSSHNTLPRAYHGVAILNGLVYFVGGFDGRDYYASVVCLDVVRMNWAARSSMHVARGFVSVAAFQGSIYAMGGFDGQVRTSSCERYDPKRNQWEFIASMHEARSDACAAAAAGRIYVIGGFTGREVLDSIESYDPCVDAWSRVLTMSRPRRGLKAVVQDEMVYVLGGVDGASKTESAEVLDARRGLLSEIPSMTVPRSYFVAGLLEDNIYVVGGGIPTVSQVERYDIKGRQWHRLQHLSIPCNAAAGVVYNDVPNAARW